MVEIRPFRPITYNRVIFDSLDSLITQPYYLTPEKRREFASLSPYNFVRVLLPPGGDPWIARRTLLRWMRKGILVREDREGIWYYGQGFSNRWGNGLRRGIVCAVSLSHESPIIPHEKVFSHFVRDRLEMLEVTGMHLEPIFLIVDSRELSELLKEVKGSVVAREPTNVWHEVSPMPEGISEEAIRYLRGKEAIIADGHHRFNAILEFWRETGNPHFLAFVAPINDNDVFILPSHRVLLGASLGPHHEAALREHFIVREIRASLIPECLKVGNIVVYDGRARCLEPADLTGLIEEIYADLPVAIAEEVVIRGILNYAGKVAYLRDWESALEAVDSGVAGLAILVRAVRPLEVLRIVERGGHMPPKSTDFYPKLASGIFMMEAL